MSSPDAAEFTPTALEHAQQPRNLGLLPAFNGHARITGPCGDTMEFWVLVRNDTVERVSFETDGCGSSLACGSMATCLAAGRRIGEAASLSQQEILDALGGLPEPVRHCALLASNTLRAAFQAYLDGSPVQGAPEEPGCEGCGDGGCAAGERAATAGADEEQADAAKLAARLGRIRHKVVVLSGKGGVGKSTVAVNLAMGLVLEGKRVGLLDIDMHGPSVPTMLGIEDEALQMREGELLPARVGDLAVLSVGLLLDHQDDAVIWRGPMKMGVIKQFLKDVAWGDLDFLVIDSPPGTGDEPLSVCQLIGDLDGAVIVTTPQKVAAVDVRKSITFCRQLRVPVLGVVENMSGFVCPTCGTVTPILQSGGGRRIAEDMRVPFLGAIPMDPQIAESCDGGRPFVQHFAASPTAALMREILAPIVVLAEQAGDAPASSPVLRKKKEGQSMRIAIPLADGKLTAHFGHCERFALIDIDPAARTIAKREDVEAPPHQPGLLPPWLAERGVNVIIAGGMGQRAQDLFAQQNIQVVLGAAVETPERLVAAHLAGTLETGDNACDH
jgi:ATP-binding protein involved in chromosome partitioning